MEKQQMSQAGSIQDSSLSDLRDQIKQVMLPLLIKTFQSKLESTFTQDGSQGEVQEQLRMLDIDLQHLLHWCNNCRSQIHDALSASGPQKPLHAKSFTEALREHSFAASKAWWKKIFSKKL